MKTFTQLIEEIKGSVKGMQYVPGKGLLVNRVGPANAQKQKHTEGNTAPAKRGIWVFPWPFNDYYYSEHQAKRYNKKSDGEYVSDERFKELLRNQMKTKQIWWDKPFYSHIAPPGLRPARQSWYLWTDAKEFVRTANQTLRGPDGSKYSIGHLELFLPMTASELKAAVA